MFQVIKSPTFEENFDPADPINKVPISVMVASAEVLAVQTDVFVRACIAKVLSPESLSLFIDSKTAVPGLDLILELQNPATRKLSVVWQGNVIGHATFTSKVTLSEDGKNVSITHESSDVLV